MKKNYLLFLVVFMAIQFNALAERINIPGLKLPGLIITEVRPDNEATAYVELTNVGTTPIDLSSFVLHSVHYNTRVTQVSDSIILFNRANAAVNNTLGKVYLKGILQPGQSHVVATVWDTNDSRGSGIPRHNTALAQKGNQFVHKQETTNTLGWINKPEWQCFGRDSVSIFGESQIELLRAEATAGYLIQWKFQKDSATIDSTYIDQFNFFYHPEYNTANGYNISVKGYEIFSIAGVDDAMTTSVMVRKASVTKGNLNWDQSRGTDAKTSEWLVIPKNISRQDAYTSVGVHGVYDLDYTVKNPSSIIVNETAKSISIPWQIERGDSLSHYFKLGKGMSWSYDFNGSFEDSASYIARTGDKFSFYAVGNEVKKAEYTLNVREPEPDVALVFPKRRLLFDENIVLDPVTGIADTVFTRYWSSGFVYAVVEGAEIDSIINVPFATRKDSLLKYLDKPAKAKLEFVYVDGKERVDLQFGDKVRVTSENGSNVKDYFVAVNDHVQGNNALLSTVTWPDMDKNLYPRWIVGDTLPEFTPLKTEYIVELRYDARNIPAFQFKTQDLRARIEVKNAVNLSGTPEQRTTSVTVIAESDTTQLTYNFQFVKQGIPVQPNTAEPFFSEWIRQANTQGYAIEIYNPGTEDLDLSRYCVVRGTAGQTWQESVETCLNATTLASFTYGADGSIKAYQTHYFPSKRWRNDATVEEWNATPTVDNPYAGKGWLIDDNQTDPWVKGGDVFVMSTGTNAGSAYQKKIIDESNFVFRGSSYNNTAFAWPDYQIYHQATPVWTRNYVYLLKVTNDSILNGKKNVRDASGYELIDRFEAMGDSLAGVKINAGQHSLVRKPSVSKGTLERIGGGNETAESSEWIVTSTGDPTTNIGLHIMTPLTNFKSTVTSVKLIVTPGYKGSALSITGNVADYTPKTISMVLDKADSSQVFVFKRGAIVLTEDQNLADADVLSVTSGDGRTTTSYKLINSPLDSDTSLTAKAGSGLIVAGTKISGVSLGMTLKEAITNLEVANKSVLNVIDTKTGALQPLMVHNLDSLVNDALVSSQVYLQVIAENSDQAVYTFDFGFAGNKAVLTSNILKIDQAKKMIMELPINTTALSMLSWLSGNEGATVRILDKAGFERKSGFMNIDDVVEVIAPDGVGKTVYGFSAEGFTVSVNRSVESPNAVVIFPNPATRVLNIQGFELASFQVFSVSGKMMISREANSSNSVDVSSLPLGIYILKMTDANGKVAVEKFLKR